MKTKEIAGIRPELLCWARETTGLSIAEVSIKLKRPEEEIRAWENGESSPSYPQLEKLAYTVYKRPLAIFFLPAPPEEKIPKQEFRTLPAFELDELQPDTRLQIRHAHAYQLALRELYDGLNPAERHIWKDNRIDLNANLKEQAACIRQYLGVTMEQQSSWHDDAVSLRQWRAAIEAVGIFVFKASFKQKDISGFCLQDEQFPLIHLNNSTTKTRQIFSLLHELSHLLLHVNGLSKFENSYINQLPVKEQKIERFCNALAAEILIPEGHFSQRISPLPNNVEQSPDTYFSTLARYFGVSREAILRRFLDRHLVREAFYKEKAEQWKAQGKQGSKKANYNAVKKSYLSERFSIEVVRQYYQQKLSIEQAANYLGVKEKTFIDLEHRIIKGKAV